MKKAGLWILVLGILLIVAVGFILVYNVIMPNIAANQETIYYSGAQDGYDTALYQIAQQTANCNTFSYTLENQTVELIAVGCNSA